MKELVSRKQLNAWAFQNQLHIFGKIHALMHDPYIKDISCDGINIPIFLYHSKYRNIETSISFEEEEFNSFVIRLCQRSGKQIFIGEPMVASNSIVTFVLNGGVEENIRLHVQKITVDAWIDVL